MIRSLIKELFFSCVISLIAALILWLVVDLLFGQSVGYRTYAFAVFSILIAIEFGIPIVMALGMLIGMPAYWLGSRAPMVYGFKTPITRVEHLLRPY